MTWLAGVDGCKGGWFRVCRQSASGALAFDVVEDVAALVTAAPAPSVVALDMPIGLPEAGRRACDDAARACLGPRRSSVFAAPIRPALAAASRAEASAITVGIDGRGVAAQAFGLYPQVRAVDEALAASPAARAALREVHPEVSFREWNGGVPMADAKRTPAGRAARLALVEAWLGPALLARARGGQPRRRLGDDDILDAVACLWTAHRIAAGRARTLPEEPPRDARGLRMEIVV